MCLEVSINIGMAPRYVRTPILSESMQDFLDGKGVGFALVEDACKAMLRIASDTTVNGMFQRWRILEQLLHQ